MEELEENGWKLIFKTDSHHNHIGTQTLNEFLIEQAKGLDWLKKNKLEVAYKWHKGIFKFIDELKKQGWTY